MKYTKNPLQKQEEEINKLLFMPIIHKNNIGSSSDFSKIKMELSILYKKLKEKNKSLGA